MSDRATLLRAAEGFGKFVASGLLSFAECESSLMQRASEITTDADTLSQLESLVLTALGSAASAHDIAVANRIRASIAPLIAARACTAALLAQARHSNNSRGRINALPDARAVDLVRSEINAAIARSRSRTRE